MSFLGSVVFSLQRLTCSSQGNAPELEVLAVRSELGGPCRAVRERRNGGIDPRTTAARRGCGTTIGNIGAFGAASHFSNVVPSSTGRIVLSQTTSPGGCRSRGWDPSPIYAAVAAANCIGRQPSPRGGKDARSCRVSVRRRPLTPICHVQWTGLTESHGIDPADSPHAPVLPRGKHRPIDGATSNLESLDTEPVDAGSGRECHGQCTGDRRRCFHSNVRTPHRHRGPSCGAAVPVARTLPRRRRIRAAPAATPHGRIGIAAGGGSNGAAAGRIERTGSRLFRLGGVKHPFQPTAVLQKSKDVIYKFCLLEINALSRESICMTVSRHTVAADLIAIIRQDCSSSVTHRMLRVAATSTNCMIKPVFQGPGRRGHSNRSSYSYNRVRSSELLSLKN